MSEQQNDRKETCLNEPKLRLHGKMLPGAEKAPVLIPDIFENNPRLRVRTNVPNDQNKGWIEVPMTSAVFAQLAESTRLLARDELTDDTGNKLQGFVVENFGHPFTQQGRSRDKKLTSKLKIEKNDRGLITMTISAGQNRPLIEIDLNEDDYHHFKDLQGNPMSLRTASKLFTIGWFNAMERMYGLALRNYVEPAWITKRKAQQAQGGGGGNWNGNQNQGNNNWGGNRGGQQNNWGGGGGGQGGGGNNYNQPQADVVEVDIPF